MYRIIPMLVGIALVVATIPMAGMATPATTQAEAELRVAPTMDTVEVGETVEYKIILDPAAGGVGAYRFSAALSDPSVGRITDVSVGGEPDLTEINYSETDDQVDVRAALADTADTGSVRVTTITIEVTDSGTTTLELADVVVGDEEGHEYDVTQINEEVAAVAATEKTLEITPKESSLDASGEMTLDLVLSDAMRGVGAYNLTVSVTDSSVAELTSVSLAGDPEFQEIEYSNENDRVQIRAAAADTAQTGQVTIATVTVTGLAEGETQIKPSATTIGDEFGFEYTVGSAEPATIGVDSASPEPPILGDEPPTDINEDGAYEDISGDGEVTAVDVQLLYANRDSSITEQNADFVDFNDDGSFSVADLQALFKIMTTSNS